MSSFPKIMVGAIVSACMAIMGFVTPSLADSSLPDHSPMAISADSVFVEMTSAWQDGNEKILSQLVHRDGLRVTHGGDFDRFTTYSPDQAFYYFQDLFQTHATTELSFRRLPDPTDGRRSLGMVEWKYLLSGRKNPEELKLVIVLHKQDAQWRLAEFNSISQR